MYLKFFPLNCNVGKLSTLLRKAGGVVKLAGGKQLEWKKVERKNDLEKRLICFYSKEKKFDCLFIKTKKVCLSFDNMVKSLTVKTLGLVRQFKV